jgi:LmbE family N-acetylglucosaminyl deacetylase
MRKIVVMFAAALSLLAVRSVAQFPSAPGTGPGLAETIEAIDSARVTTRILYVTAHPDDERADVLTYLARGLHADVALLSLTRGEGGQNALGPEQAPQLGLIRTQELLAATRGYGVKLYFTRAKDFGYSKTPEETEKIWGDQVVEDMVRVIRTFRPNIVINNWGGVHQGHGHHQASGLLTPIAVQRAADANAYPEQLKEGLQAWGGVNNEVVILDLDRSDKPIGYVLPLEEISPLWGKSWREIGLDAFANHRTQGVSAFLGSPFFRRPLALKREDGKTVDPKDLERTVAELGSDSTHSGCEVFTYGCAALKDADQNLQLAHKAALEFDWWKTSSLVVRAERDFASLLPGDVRPYLLENNNALRATLEHLHDRAMEAKRLVDGLEVSARADRGKLVVGETLHVTASFRCRAEIDCKDQGLNLESDVAKITGKKEDGYGGVEFTLQVTRPAPELNKIQKLIPERPQLLYADQIAADNGAVFFLNTFPVTYIQTSSTRAERVPIQIVPAYTLTVEPKQTLELVEERKEFDVFLRVHSYSTKAAKVSVGLDVPKNWVYSGPVDVAFTGEGDRYTKFTVTPPAGLAAGNYPLKAFATLEGTSFTTSIEPLPSMPTLTWEEPAQTVVHAFDIKVPENLRVGYISAESEPVPDALKMLGIKVEMLDANALNFEDLSKYDAIVVGVRAYELRTELPGANQRLLDYARNGGTLVVQYQRDFAWDGKNYAPYPSKIGTKPGEPLPRITDENSPVKFLKPDDPLLNTPNKITQDDFKGWVQERGLYFWSEYDSQYTPLLAMNDPGEKDLDGSLLYTKLGKGTYIYTGIAFFRQLPEGVPGAYRLFVNLLAASRSH